MIGSGFVNILLKPMWIPCDFRMVVHDRLNTRIDLLIDRSCVCVFITRCYSYVTLIKLIDVYICLLNLLMVIVDIYYVACCICVHVSSI